MRRLRAHLKLAEGNQGSTICGNGRARLLRKGTDATQNAKEMRVRVVSYHNEGQSVRTFPWDFCQSGDLRPCTHPDWHRRGQHVLSLAPAGSAVSVDEFEDWIKWINPAMMQLRPLSGTDAHEYAQLVKLLKEKDYVSRRCSHRAVLLFFLTVCRFGVGY